MIKTYIRYSIILFTTFVVTPVLAVPVGSVDGVFSVSETGGANYSIPIDAPKGPLGIAPGIAINYSSQAGLGKVGAGGSISGFSVISRCPAGRRIDGYFRAINNDIYDQYCLNGERLILISGEHGQTGSIYSTELDSGKKITIGAIQEGMPRWFEVNSPDGSVQRFGWNQSSRIEKNNGIPISWLISRFRDVNGNTIDYHYDDINSVSSYPVYSEKIPKWIFYGDRTTSIDAGAITGSLRIRLQWEARPDNRFGWRAGMPAQSTRRLSKVSTILYRGGKNETIASYQISYEQAGKSGESRIREITKCNPNKRCYRPTLFEWRDLANRWNPSAYGPGRYAESSKNNYSRATSVDLNNDGWGDWVEAWRKPNGEDVLVTWLNGPNGYQIATNWQPPTILFDHQRDGQASGSLADVNGDGLPDWIYATSINGVSNRQIFLNTGNGWRAAIDWQFPADLTFSEQGFHESRAVLVDMNADGLVDVVSSFRSHLGGNTRTTWLNTGQGWVDSHAYLPPHDLMEYLSHRNRKLGVLADLNADGLPDWVVATKKSRTTEVFDTWMNTGLGWRHAPAWQLKAPLTSYAGSLSGKVVSELIDVNGDGLPDQVMAYDEDNEYRATWINNGRRFIGTQDYRPPVAMRNVEAEYSHTYGSFMDMNHDGLPEIVISYKDTNGQKIEKTWLNTGTSWIASNGFRLPAILFENRHEDDSINAAYLLDINADGRNDLIRSRSGEDVQTWLNNATDTGAHITPHLMQITNAFGHKTKIDYATTTDERVYTKAPIAAYPKIAINNPATVVFQVSTSDGIGSLATSKHHYGESYIDAQAQGSLGFRWSEVRDIRTNIIIRSEASQAWPFIGQTQTLQKLVIENGTRRLLQKSDNQFEQIDTNNGLTTIPVESGSINITHPVDTSGGNSNTTTIQRQFDQYGNITEEITTKTDNIQTETLISRTQYKTLFNGLGFLPAIATKEHHFTGQASHTTATNFDYDVLGRLIEVTTNPGTEHETKTTHSYDDWGNELKTSVTARTASGELSSRTSSKTMTGDGRFTRSVTTPLGHTTTFTTHPYFGETTRVEHPDGTIKVKRFNGFGVLLADTEQRFDPVQGNAQEITEKRQILRTVWCTANSNCPTNSLYFAAIQGNAKESPETVYFDMLGRQVRKATFDFTGKPIYVDSSFDAFGRNTKTSNPYRKGDVLNDNQYTHKEYDNWGRLIKVSAPGQYGLKVTSYEYIGDSTIVTTPEGSTLTKYFDLRGNVIKTVDALGSETLFEYDVKNRLTVTTDPAQQVTETIYDTLGRKIETRDPALGIWSYQYDGFDRLISQTDSRGNTIEMQYDQMGRLIQRTEPDFDATTGIESGKKMTSWVYDAGVAPGQLAKVVTSDSNGQTTFSRDLRYDQYGRVASTTTNIDNQRFVIKNHYEGTTDRITGLTYPNGRTVRYLYNDFGYPSSIHTGADSYFLEYKQQYQSYQKRIADVITYEDENIDQYNELKNKITGFEAKAKPFLDKAERHRQTAIKYQGYFNSKRNEYNAVLGSQKDWFEWFTNKVMKPAGPLLTALNNKNNELTAHNNNRPVRPVVAGAAEDRESDPIWIAYEAAFQKWLNRRNNIYDAINNLLNQLKPYQGHLDSGSDKYNRLANLVEPIVKSMNANAIVIEREGRLMQQEIAKAQPFIDQANPLVEAANKISEELGRLNKRAENAGDLAKSKLDAYKAAATSVWQALSLTVDGKVHRAKYGNNVKVHWDYNTGSNAPEAFRAWRVNDNGNSKIMDQQYKFDDDGNLIKRRDALQQLTETFEYDAINRLAFNNIQGNWLDLNPEYTGQTFVYDNLGNLENKTGVGQYYYEDSASKNRLTSIVNGTKTRIFEYDQAGNQITSGNRTLHFNAHQKPVLIKVGSTRQELYYGPGQELIKNVEIINGKKSTAYRLGDFERIVTQDEVTDRITIKSSGDTVAIITASSKDGNAIDFLLTDYLGSVLAKVNASGVVMERIHYDPFGKARAAVTPQSVPSVTTTLITDHGFGGHIDLANVGLVHMGGRVYDAEIGRFLSADPNIQFPYFSQGLNRYSYLLNNPLSYADPTGYFLSKLLKKLKKYLFKFLRKIAGALKHVTNWARRHLNELVQITILMTVGVTAKGIFPKALGKAAFVTKAIGSTVSYLMNGGSFKNFLKSFVVSQLVGQIPFGGKLSILDAPLKAGLTAKLLGGSFSKGFKSFYQTMVTGIMVQQVISGLIGKLNGVEKIRDNEDRRGLYHVYQETAVDGSMHLAHVKVNSINTDTLYVNGILGDTVDRVAYLGHRHTGASDFNIFYNPTGGFVKDMLQSLQGKLLGSTNESQALVGYLQNGPQNLHIYAHSQGGIITSNALNLMSANSTVDLSGWSINWHGAAISRSSAFESSAKVGISAENVHWDASNLDAVPQFAGLNVIRNPAGILSMLAVPTLFMGERQSFHTLPTWAQRDGLEPN